MKSVNLAVGVSLLAVACTPPPETSVSSGEPQIDLVDQEIVAGIAESSNGVNAAVYHFNDAGTCDGTPTPAGWFPRPCSGTILKRTGTQTFVLTARHCVTRDGSIGGPLVATTGSLKVSTELNPGPVPPGGTPPPSALPATLLYVGSATATGSTGDLAIIRVDSQLPLTGPRRMELFRGTKTELASWGVKLDFGYGRNTPGHCGSEANSGAGRLRSGFFFTLTNIEDAQYAYSNNNSSGQQITNGDSGGGAYIYEPDSHDITLIGVHSTGGAGFPTGVDAGSVKLAEFIQARLGGLFLSRPEDAQNNNNVVGVATAGAGNQVQWNRSGDVSTNRVYFLESANRLQIAGYCVNDEGNGVPVKLQLCNAAVGTQNWTLTQTQIKNVSTGRCLNANASGTVFSNPCDWGTAHWAWLSAATK